MGYICGRNERNKRNKKAMKNQEPRSTSSCAACKLLKRKCNPNCQFAPYFHSNDQKKFAKVHKVFGASNVSKILKEVTEDLREDTVNSLVYEAEVRLKDPVYGCIGAIISLQKKMEELQHDLILAKTRLAYCAAAANSTCDSCTSLILNDHALSNDTMFSSNENQDFSGSIYIDGMLSYTGLPLEPAYIDENYWFV